jgi:subtilisin-like proprotein convertase family protein
MIMRRKLPSFALALFSAINLCAQVGIGNTNPSATLDIQGANHNGAVTATDGILVPRVNSLSVSGNQDGQLVYLIADVGTRKKGFYHWNLTKWNPISISSSPSLSQNVVAPDAFPVVTAPTAFTITPNSAIANNTAYANNIIVSGVTGTTTLVTLSLTIAHTNDADLDIFLQSPTGQILELSTDNGGTGDNYTNTVFSDAGASNITAGTAPFTGTFRPEGTLTASGAPLNITANITTFAGFNGAAPNGTWILRIGDDLGGNTGTFNSATLNISGNTVDNWVLLGEVSIAYLSGTAVIVQSSYSGDPSDLTGVITSLTRSTASAGAIGMTTISLPGTVLNYASASPSGNGNFWVNTFNQTRNVGLLDETIYFYQLWRKGNIESPVASNETYSLIPFRIRE